jgi:hypothetical protein
MDITQVDIWQPVDSSSHSPAGECGFRHVFDARSSEGIKVAITKGRTR